MTKLTQERILSMLRTGCAAERAEFVRHLPPNGFKDAAVGLVGSDNPGMVVAALGSLAQQYAYGSDPECGAALASALHERALEIHKSDPDNGLIPTTLSGLACSHAKALSLLGRSSELVAVTTRYITLYQQLDERENLPSLKVLQIEALVNLGQIDAADAKLQEAKLENHPILGMEAQRLRSIVDRIKADPTKLPWDDDTASSGPSAEGLLDILKTAIGIGFEGDAATEIAKQIDQLDTGNRLDPRDPVQYQQLLDTLAKGESFLTRGGKNSELAVRGTVREASALFVHGTPAPAVIEKSLAQLQQGRAWAHYNQVADLENDALWGSYLCNSRLDRPSDAADALISLRTNLESIRHGICDPLSRGGVFRAYPHLFPALCEKLQKAGRTEELLEAIESSKGRVIADKLTEQAGDAVQDAAIYGCVARLPELARRTACHYLTFFVDEESVYAVLVSKRGQIHSIDPVLINKGELRDASRAARPALWGQPKPWSPGSKFPNVSELLQPLVAWLDDLLEEGVLEEGDHLCYSSDDDFYNVPLHYLRLRDGIVLDWLSVSRMHSAFHFDYLLGRPPSAPTDRYLGVVVPLREDLDRDGGEQMLANLDAPIDWLDAHGLEGASIRLEAATPSRVKAEELDHGVVHFSTHGWFPEDGNPFRESYLVLADEHGLPDMERVVRGRYEGRLTPQVVLDAGLDLRDSHVSMMACLSGLAKEGIAGDTLGLDWALIQSGASSLISTHWRVSAACAARFFECFYAKWIEGRQSRASAWRETMLKFINGDYSPGSLDYWSAFSLTGDFR